MNHSEDLQIQPTTILRIVCVGDNPRLDQPDKKLPALTWIPIEKLRINDVYQRPIMRTGWSQIKKIAHNFNWSSFTPVMVSKIKNDCFSLIDGQHRAHAALLAGYSEVPAVVVEINQTEQAAAFARINSQVTRMNVHSIYKAALAAGETWAIESEKAVSNAGCKLMTSNKSTKDKSPGDISGIVTIRKMVENHEANAVTKGLHALKNSASGQFIDVYNATILKYWLTVIASNSAYLHIDLITALNKKVDLLLLDEKARKESKETKEPKPTIFKQLIKDGLDKFRHEKS